MKYWVIFVFYNLILSKFSTPSDVVCDIIAATDITPTKISPNWGTCNLGLSLTDPCEPPVWGGLTCSGGEIDAISLNGENIKGTLPSSIVKLTKLSILDFGQNKLNGTIPESFGYLSKVRYLDLSYNKIFGSVPTSLGRMSSLIQLIFSANKLTNTIPTTLGMISVLRFIYLDHNSLRGSIPTTLAKHSTLSYFDISANLDIRDRLPSVFGSMSTIRYLAFNNNHMIGTIPSSYGLLANLNYFALSQNMVTGTIPTSLGLITKGMYDMRLYQNRLQGTIPTSFAHFTKAQKLIFGYNCLTGTIPSAFGLFPFLTYLDMQANSFTGTIPGSLGSTGTLSSLYLNDNSLTGVAPANLSKVNLFDIHTNRLQDNVMCNLGDALRGGPRHVSYVCGVTTNTTQKLSLSAPAGYVFGYATFASYGNATGHCPDFTRSSCHASTSVAVVNAACYGNTSCTFDPSKKSLNTIFGGDPCWGVTKYLRIVLPLVAQRSTYVCAALTSSSQPLQLHAPTGYYLGNVTFASYGTPTGVCEHFAQGSCHASESVNIINKLCSGKSSCVIDPTVTDYNTVFGGDPCVGTTKYLYVQAPIYASSAWSCPKTQYVSDLVCSVPWAGVSCSNGKVSEISFSSFVSNPVNGTIPSSLGFLSSLTSIDFSSNSIKGSIPTALGLLTNLVKMDFSDTAVTGTIPYSLQLLNKLQVLNLANMKLTKKPLPAHLGYISALTYLSVTFNKFTGSIPPDLCNLKQLDYFGFANTSLKCYPYCLLSVPTLYHGNISRNCYVPTGQPTGRPTGAPTTILPSLTYRPTRKQPSGQPTGQPSLQPSGQPSGQPTARPSISKSPTGQPSGQPTAQPSAQPSGQPTGMPTGQPTSMPTKFLDPEFRMRESVNMTYWCRPTHPHSAPNAWQRIEIYFNITHSLDLQAAYIWVKPYTKHDLLTIDGNDYQNLIFAKYAKGLLTLQRVTDLPWSSPIDWENLLTKVMYKLSSKEPCTTLTDANSMKTFYFQIRDKFHRTSNVITKKMVLKTAYAMFTTDNAITITDSPTGYVVANSIG